jgi:hypothetical protein
MNQRRPTISNTSIDTASWITLRWTRGSRFFRVHLEQDLWSRTRLGRARATPARL